MNSIEAAVVQSLHVCLNRFCLDLDFNEKKSFGKENEEKLAELSQHPGSHNGGIK